MEYPLISIVVPLYNCEKFIVDAVDSALNQTYPNIEIIITDDGSSDNSLSVVKSKYSKNNKIKILQHSDLRNHGVSKTRKIGLEHSHGKYVAFLDADDMFEPDKLRVQVEILENNTDIILVHTCVKLINEAKNQLGYNGSGFEMSETEKKYIYLNEDYLNYNPICNSSVLLRKDVFIKSYISYPQIFQFEDWANWILLAFHGHFYYLNRPLTIYRFHSESSTFNLIKNRVKFLSAKMDMLYVLLSIEDISTIRNGILKSLHITQRDIVKFYAENIISDRKKTPDNIKYKYHIFAFISITVEFVKSTIKRIMHK